MAAACLLLLSIPIAGCGGGNVTNERPYEYDRPVTKRLRQLSREGPHGATRRLVALTDFTWDTAFLFAEETRHHDIDAAVGTEVFRSDGSYSDNEGSLLIFTLHGRVVHAVSVVPPVFLGGRSRAYPREDAWVRARTKDPGPYALELFNR